MGRNSGSTITKTVIYIATATLNSLDTEWMQRIQKHKQRRFQDWVTLEVPRELSATLAEVKPNSCLVIDSLGTWVANLLEQDEVSWQNTVREFLETVQLVAVHMILLPKKRAGELFQSIP